MIKSRCVLLSVSIILPLGLLAFVLSLASSAAAQSSPQEPLLPETNLVDKASISLSKTVGLNPKQCATGKNITMPSGSTAVYCYEITNDGDTPLSTHTLFDDQLGSLLVNFPYTLDPGESAFLTTTAVLTNTTVNTAVWTAFNAGPTNEVSDRDSATVTVVPPSIELMVTVGTNPTFCAPDSVLNLQNGGKVTFCYQVTNTGLTPLPRHTLTDDLNGPIILSFPYTLAPGASAFLTQTVDIKVSTINTAEWIAFDPDLNISATDSNSANVIVEHLIHLPIVTSE